MNTVLILLGVQGLLGAFDNLWHHELQARLPAHRSARTELALHAAREGLYAFFFFAIAWYTWHGSWAYLLAAVLIIELVITLADFVVEDLTRKLPKLERVLHTILAINIGAVLALLAPVLIGWSRQATELVAADYGWLSWLMTAYAAGVLAWALRNVIAVVKHFRPPTWRRAPLLIGKKPLPRKILITGATGFIGRHLCRALVASGEQVLVLTRDGERAKDLFGPAVEVITALESIPDSMDIDVVINLAGAPILGWPWTQRRRRELVDSRVRTTRACVALIRRLRKRPELLISASAIGFYGLRGNEVINETGKPQAIFQSELCKAWECAAAPLEALGVRVCRLRIGLVLGADGGAFPAMARPIRLGLGAVLGSGRQYLSWIHVTDLVRLMEWLIVHTTVRGVVNATAPTPVMQREFAETIAASSRRRIYLRAPAWPIRLGLGEMSQLLLDGQRVMPEVALAQGFEWKFPELRPAVETLLVEPRNQPMACSAIVFDGSCPVCNAEISRIKAKGDALGIRMDFHDITNQPQALADYGLDYDDARRRLYAYDKLGNVRSGFDADLVMWEQIPALRAWARLLRLPGIYQLCDLAYDLVIAPSFAAYAAHRRSRDATTNAIGRVSKP